MGGLPVATVASAQGYGGDAVSADEAAAIDTAELEAALDNGQAIAGPPVGLDGLGDSGSKRS